ncbi:AraC family transcriptional regulator [Bifidobacterium favimelis]|uniref:AraC family transcriptional regulator n=1 Tax=Bifidobacterium favimelis TaxID=3122979 RepID=A0ABU8ZMD6_9BIFI
MEFQSAGRFIGTPGWIHERRKVDSFELILVEDGTLPLTVDGSHLELGPNDLVLIPPESPHEGSRRLKHSSLTFFWAHFAIRGWQAVDESSPPDGRPQGDKDHMVLPIGRTSVRSDRLNVMFNQLLDIYQRSYPNPSTYCSYFMTCMLMEMAIGMTEAGVLPTGNDERNKLQQVHDWIRINACDRITVKRVSDYFNYSPSYLSTIYKRQFGISISTQMARIRIERAQDLLLSTSMNVRDVAAACGYSDAKYFMRMFKRQTGLTPTRYRSSFNQRHYNNA